MGRGQRLQTLEVRGLDFADVTKFDAESLETNEDRRADYGEPPFNVIGYLAVSFALIAGHPAVTKCESYR